MANFAQVLGEGNEASLLSASYWYSVQCVPAPGLRNWVAIRLAGTVTVFGNGLGVVEKETAEDDTGKLITEYKSPTINLGMGLRIRYKSNYRPVSKINDDLDKYSNLHESLHPALVCYVK